MLPRGMVIHMASKIRYTVNFAGNMLFWHADDEIVSDTYVNRNGEVDWLTWGAERGNHQGLGYGEGYWEL